jgi:hypothetical protein
MTISVHNRLYSILELNSNIGKRAAFLNPYKDPERVFSFSSTLDKIGFDWDRQLKNNTNVIILSDPVELNREPYGVISVTKISAEGEEIWVRTDCLVDIT